jgi:hypothetical protein
MLTLQRLYAAPHPTRGHNSIPWPYKEAIEKGTKFINLVSKVPTCVLLGFLATAHILCYTIYTCRKPNLQKINKTNKAIQNPTFPTPHQSPITQGSPEVLYTQRWCIACSVSQVHRRKHQNLEVKKAKESKKHVTHRTHDTTINRSSGYNIDANCQRWNY